MYSNLLIFSNIEVVFTRFVKLKFDISKNFKELQFENIYSISLTEVVSIWDKSIDLKFMQF